MRYVAFDFETAGLEARYDKNVPVWCVGFAWRDEHGELKSKWYNWVLGQKHLSALAADTEVRLVAHNASFDVAVARTRGVGIEPSRYHDTLLLSYLTRPGSTGNLGEWGGHGLEDWGQRLGREKIDFRQVCIDKGYIEPKAKRGAEFFINYAENNEALSDLGTYCARDCEVALLVFEKLVNSEYTDKKLRNCYYELELPYGECLMEMENTGLYVNTERLKELKERLEFRRAALTSEIQSTYSCLPEQMDWDKKHKVYVGRAKEYKNGVSKNKNNAKHYTHHGVLMASEPSLVYDHCPLSSFSTTNSRHLAWCLLREGWKPEAFTDSGLPSTEAEVVDTLDYPIAKLYTEVSELEKLLGTFVTGLLDRLDSRNFVHGSFSQCLTVTTRLSSSNPNLQNLPANGIGKDIRRCMTAPPGYDIIVGDLDAIELRVLAYYLQAVCGDTTMSDAIRAGLDLHQANADKWGISRKDAKTTIFGLVYGQTARGLAGRLGVSEEEAQTILDGVYAGTPALSELMSSIHRTCRQREGVLYTLMGNRLYYPDIMSHNKWDRMRAERQAQNAVIQGSAAGINKELQLQALPLTRKFNARQSTVVHDELLIYCPTTFTDELCFELNTKVYQNKDLLSKADWYIPVTATFAKGRDWVEAKEAG